MEAQQDRRTPGRGPSRATSRRDLHRKDSRLRAFTAHTLPKLLVVAALGGATIAVPVTKVVAVDAPATQLHQAAALDLPSTYEVLTDSAAPMTTTRLLAAPGANRVTDTASRSLDRDPLPGCHGTDLTSSANGQIPAADLCALWDGSQYLRGDAAVAITELNTTFRAAFGRDLCITDSYRDLASQRALARTKPGLAATPGKSNHGWGLAVDLCSAETRSSAVMQWLRENGPVFGWDNPDWARSGGSGPYEPWHWEFEPGTSQMGTNWDDN